MLRQYPGNTGCRFQIFATGKTVCEQGKRPDVVRHFKQGSKFLPFVILKQKFLSFHGLFPSLSDVTMGRARLKIGVASPIRSFSERAARLRWRY
jgi:hypothetical protein